VSGVVGSYIVTLTADAGISMDLEIEPGQDVHISGDVGLAVAPSWGRGGFTLQERGSLALQHLTLISGTITINHGTVSLISCTGSLSGLVVTAGAFRVDSTSTVDIG
jgi:hypothetical protein